MTVSCRFTSCNLCKLFRVNMLDVEKDVLSRGSPARSNNDGFPGRGLCFNLFEPIAPPNLRLGLIDRIVQHEASVAAAIPLVDVMNAIGGATGVA